MGVKPGLATPPWRKYGFDPINCAVRRRLSDLPRLSNSDLFVVWARCKWDDKVRGFLLEKVCLTHVFPRDAQFIAINHPHVRFCVLTGSQRSFSSSHEEQALSTCLTDRLYFP